MLDYFTSDFVTELMKLSDEEVLQIAKHEESKKSTEKITEEERKIRSNYID